MIEELCRSLGVDTRAEYHGHASKAYIGRFGLRIKRMGLGAAYAHVLSFPLRSPFSWGLLIENSGKRSQRTSGSMLEYLVVSM